MGSDSAAGAGGEAHIVGQRDDDAAVRAVAELFLHNLVVVFDDLTTDTRAPQMGV